MQIRLGDVWDEMLAFSRRERALVIPVALAFLGLPQLLSGLVATRVGDPKADAAGAALFYLCIAGGAAVSLIGNLALSALVLNPGGSVGEALEVALRRSAGALGAVTIVMLLALFACIPTGIVLGLLHVRFDPSTPDPAFALLLVVVMITVAVIAARLALVWPWIIGHGRGNWAALRGAFMLSRPVAWRLLLTVVLFFMTLQVVLWAIGLVGKPIAVLTGAATAVDAIVALAMALVAAAGGALWTIFCACLYRRLEDPNLSAIFE